LEHSEINIDSVDTDVSAIASVLGDIDMEMAHFTMLQPHQV